MPPEAPMMLTNSAAWTNARGLAPPFVVHDHARSGFGASCRACLTRSLTPRQSLMVKLLQSPEEEARRAGSLAQAAVGPARRGWRTS